MEEAKTIRCVRCKGQKKMFKVNSVYSHTNTGGIQVECPLCMGAGFTKSIEDSIAEMKKENIKHKKDLKDERQKEESRGETY